MTITTEVDIKRDPQTLSDHLLFLKTTTTRETDGKTLKEETKTTRYGSAPDLVEAIGFQRFWTRVQIATSMTDVLAGVFSTCWAIFGTASTVEETVTRLALFGSAGVTAIGSGVYLGSTGSDRMEYRLNPIQDYIKKNYEVNVEKRFKNADPNTAT